MIDGQWVHQGEAKTRRILHSSLIASSIEYELNKFIAGELILVHLSVPTFYLLVVWQLVMVFHWQA